MKFGRTVFGIALCVLLGGCSTAKAPVQPEAAKTAAQSPEPVPANLPDWKPDAQLMPKLQETINSTKFPPKFVQQLPKGYHISPREEAWRKEYMFFGPTRADKSRVVFMVNALNGKMGNAKEAPKLAEATLSFMNAIKNGRSGHWTNTKPEDGMINGLRYQRVYWSGEEPTSQQQMKGFVYVTRVGDEFVEFAAQDLAKYDKDTIELLDSAVKTTKFVQ